MAQHGGQPERTSNHNLTGQAGEEGPLIFGIRGRPPVTELWLLDREKGGPNRTSRTWIDIETLGANLYDP